MGWITEDDEHEGWAAGVLGDGRAAGGSDLNGVYVEHGEWAPQDQVAGFQCCCTCGWRGAYWRRVPEVSQADSSRRLAYSEHGADVAADVEAEMHSEWLEHVRPSQLVAGVRLAVQAHAATRERLDETVLAARQRGASWAEIGEAVGISRQSAHERWAALVP